MEHETLINLAADIVSAHVSHNSVAANEVPGLIAAVYGSLASVGKPAPVATEKREPAVPVRTSVKPDAITCLECGVKMKMLKRHIATDHGLSPADYRTRWELPSSYPLVAPNYAAKRRDLAKQIGLGRKPGHKVVRKTQRGRPKMAAAANSE